MKQPKRKVISYSASRDSGYGSRAVIVQYDDSDQEMLDPRPSQKLYNHSPDGFEWGYGGSGPAQLALAILLHYTGNPKEALMWHQDFKWEFMAKAPQEGFVITADQIERYLSLPVIADRPHR